MILLIVGAVAVIAAGIAIKKHGSLAAAEASAKKEAANLEALLVRVEQDAKADVLAVIARLKKL
jgi:hypothetical protein